MEPMLGEIRLVGFNFSPRGWAFCNGQIMSIAQNTALFSILGTTFGGDGITTFALPNLQGRQAVGGMSEPSLGQVWGQSSVTLTGSNLPAMGAQIGAVDGGASSSQPANGVLAEAQQAAYIQGEPSVGLDRSSIQSGQPGNQPIPVGGPNLTINYIIALEGIYPSRS